MNDVKARIEATDLELEQIIRSKRKEIGEKIEAMVKACDACDIVINSGMYGLKDDKRKIVSNMIEEAKEIQSNGIKSIEVTLKKVFSYMDGIDPQVSGVEDIICLTEQMKIWKKCFLELFIPSSKHSQEYKSSVPGGFDKELKKWEDFCKNSPIVKEAKKTERIRKLKNKIIDLENAIHDKREELQDRTERSEFYEEEIKKQVAEEIDSVEAEMRRKKGYISNLEFEYQSLMQQLSKEGLLAFGKKKELKLQLSKKASEIEGEKAKLPEYEKKRSVLQNSLNDRIAGLKEIAVKLSGEVRSMENELESAKAELERSNL